MSETSEFKLYGFFQSTIYFSLLLETAVFILPHAGLMPAAAFTLVERIAALPVYDNILYSKLFTLSLIVLSAIGTRAKKNLAFSVVRHVFIPLFVGLSFFFGALFLYTLNSTLQVYAQLSIADVAYLFVSLVGTVFINVALDNISKHVQTGLMKDRFNVENESFQQSKKKEVTAFSLNVPILFYYQQKIQRGWLNIPNTRRSVLTFGTPGSGKTFGFFTPCIKQHLARGYSELVYDFKYPDLARVAYYHYLLNKQKGVLAQHKFHMVNLNHLEKSRRVNPLHPAYTQTLGEAFETAEATIEAVRKDERARGSDQFFTQSAINFLASCIYFFSHYQDGRYSTLPHVLAFLNRSYGEIFDVLFQEPELFSALSPFYSAYQNRAFDQLEGQLGTLKINLSRLANKETFWVFSGNDVNLRLSDKADPSVLVLCNDPSTQSINSTCYSVLLNRIVKQVNQKNNLPITIIADEFPTLYFHKIETLIATARSNNVSVLLGLQDLAQLRQNYGKETADAICSVPAHIVSGGVNSKDTLDWLEKIIGKTRQLRHGVNIDRHRTTVNMNEYMDFLIPASKIANLKAGEFVAKIAQEAGKYDGKYTSSVYNCRINLNVDKIKEEESNYLDLPNYYNFGSALRKKELLYRNLEQIYQDIAQVINHVAV